jgi:hypothetical protein
MGLLPPSFNAGLKKGNYCIPLNGDAIVADIKEVLSSRPGEFHPKSLIEPYLIVSHHTALINHYTSTDLGTSVLLSSFVTS